MSYSSRGSIGLQLHVLTVSTFSRPGLPKRFQSFLFFQIHKPTEFKERLKRFIDDSKITTAEDACAMKQKIAAVKDKSQAADKNAPFLPLPGINIAFASTGLYKVSNIFLSSTFPHCRTKLTDTSLQQLGKFVQTSDQGKAKADKELYNVFREKQLKGGLFEKGMYDDLVGEGWDDPNELLAAYKPTEDKKRKIDGVLTVTSSLESDILQQVKDVCDYFLKDGIVSLPLIREGNVRPDPHKGREQ